jgi:DNA-binding response OmpR family regulator
MRNAPPSSKRRAGLSRTLFIDIYRGVTKVQSLCPTCGQQIAPLELVVCLNSETATRFGKTIKLSGSEAVILHTLHGHGGVLMRGLARALYGKVAGPKAEPSGISNVIRRLRVKIAPICVRIENNRDGRGYFAVLDDSPVERAQHRRAA